MFHESTITMHYCAPVEASLVPSCLLYLTSSSENMSETSLEST